MTLAAFHAASAALVSLAVGETVPPSLRLPIRSEFSAAVTTGGVVTVTGADLSVNGVDTVPVGLFGVHATPLSAAQAADWGIEAVRRISHLPPAGPTSNGVPFTLDCFFDRYQPAVCLTRPDWREWLTEAGRRYAAAADPRVCAVEFWNEPYLNWACKPGVNYDGA